ncbi:hypothetical protein CAMRE0001_3092 [Campylobacter rectus RM3267]|uniref:Uncharacterized protein n=1 Tax=Campylobacter rectus RM3267 TaxID=553218 RepID=B9D4P7_CAMRE|nr:hypothetical protein CAMRE0001_3092 [Campylobacter rectus RM3267]
MFLSTLPQTELGGKNSRLCRLAKRFVSPLFNRPRQTPPQIPDAPYPQIYPPHRLAERLFCALFTSNLPPHKS